jgi:hypothetical protein
VLAGAELVNVRPKVRIEPTTTAPLRRRRFPRFLPAAYLMRLRRYEDILTIGCAALFALSGLCTQNLEIKYKKPTGAGGSKVWKLPA